MSKIGKAPVEIPKGVQIEVKNQTLSCKGPLGTLTLELGHGISAKVENNHVTMSRSGDEKLARAMHGTSRALVANMVEGVTKGYSKQLEIVGVGYKAVIQGKKLALTVGFANTLEIPIPAGVKVELPDQTHVNLSGTDKCIVGQFAANIRSLRKPEPYKGKGVRYVGEQVRRKAGKAAAGAGAAPAKK
jgi:large subunit ribosomal protein L6